MTTDRVHSIMRVNFNPLVLVSTVSTKPKAGLPTPWALGGCLERVEGRRPRELAGPLGDKVETVGCRRLRRRPPFRQFGTGAAVRTGNGRVASRPAGRGEAGASGERVKS